MMTSARAARYSAAAYSGGGDRVRTSGRMGKVTPSLQHVHSVPLQFSLLRKGRPVGVALHEQCQAYARRLRQPKGVKHVLRRTEDVIARAPEDHASRDRGAGV